MLSRPAQGAAKLVAELSLTQTYVASRVGGVCRVSADKGAWLAVGFDKPLVTRHLTGRLRLSGGTRTKTGATCSSLSQALHAAAQRPRAEGARVGADLGSHRQRRQCDRRHKKRQCEGNS